MRAAVISEALATRVAEPIRVHPTYGYRRLWALLRCRDDQRLTRRTVYRLCERQDALGVSEIPLLVDGFIVPDGEEVTTAASWIREPGIGELPPQDTPAARFPEHSRILKVRSRQSI